MAEYPRLTYDTPEIQGILDRAQQVYPDTPENPKEGDIRVIPESEEEVGYTISDPYVYFTIPSDKPIKVTAPEDATSLCQTFGLTSQGLLVSLTLADLPREYQTGELASLTSVIGTTQGAGLPIVTTPTPGSVDEYINGQWEPRGALPADILRYSPQTLTAAQKNQARENLDLYRDNVDNYKVEAVGTPLAQVGFMQSGMLMAYYLFQSYKNGEVTAEVPTAEQLVAVGKYQMYQDGSPSPITSGMIIVKSAKTYMINTYGGSSDYGAICVTQGSDTITVGNIQVSTLTFTEPGVYVLGQSNYYNAYGLYWETSEAVKIPQRFLPEMSTDIEADKTSDTKVATPKAVWDAIQALRTELGLT